MLSLFKRGTFLECLQQQCKPQTINGPLYQETLRARTQQQENIESIIQPYQHGYMYRCYGFEHVLDDTVILFKSPLWMGSWTVKAYTKEGHLLDTTPVLNDVYVDMLLYHISQVTESSFLLWLQWAMDSTHFTETIEALLSEQYDLKQLQQQIAVLGMIPLPNYDVVVETDIFLS